MNKKKLFKYFPYLVSPFLVGAIFLFVNLPFFRDFNNLILDRLQGELSARQEVVVVGIDDESLQQIGSWPWDRSVFSDVIKKIDEEQPIVMGFDVLFLESRSGDDKVIEILNTINSKVVFGSKLIDGEVIRSVYSGSSNTEDGFVNFTQDADGKIRETKVFEKFDDGSCEVSFSLSLVKEYFGIENKDELCNDILKLRANSFNVDSDNQLRFSYSRQKFSYVSFSDVINGNYEAGLFKDKVVLIGSTALDVRSNLNDNFTNIFGNNVPGIDIHANIVNSFLQENFLNNVNTNILFYALLVLTFLLTYIYLKLRILIDTAIFTIILVLNIVLCFVLIELKFLLPVVSIFFILSWHYIFNIVYKYLLKSNENKYIKSAFGKYINSALLHQLMLSPEKLKLGGEQKEMTILFSDIRKFTTISEGMAPADLVNMLNNYLQSMTAIILSNNGTIDKYIGDAIMAFWNAPIDDANHAQNGLLTGLNMLKTLEEFREKYPLYPVFNIGISLNTGVMVPGNIGGKERFDYTVLGDNVNLGSRLEGLTKMYGVPFIISDSTKLKVDNIEGVIYRMLDIVIVKGRKTPLKIWEARFESEESKKIFDIYAKAFELYQNKKFEDAKKMFESNSNDPASNMMSERCNELIAQNSEHMTSEGVWKWEEK